MLQTKLYRPPINDDYLYRDHLIDLLNQNKDRPFSLVCAPSGYGKSMLISSWLENCECHYIWLSLSDDENDFRTFLENILFSINSVFPDSLENFAALLKGPELPPIKIIAETLINDLDDITKDFVLVLDDFHLINNQQINELIDKVLKYPTQNMHLVIISRRDPSINLSSLRSHGRMNEVRMRDLSFNTTEVSELFKKLSPLKLNDKSISSIHEKTEGWVTGLRLILLTLHDANDVDKLLKNLEKGFFNISEFLMEEVIRKQPIEIQNTLLSSSILDRLSADLITEVCFPDNNKLENRGEEFINWLINSNLFLIPLDLQNHWFRYHHLFQDILLEQFKNTTNPEKIKTIHARASNWFEQNGFMDQAIHHAHIVGDLDKIVSIIEKYRNDALNNDKWHILERWLLAVPFEVQQQKPILLLTQAWISYQQTKIDEVVGVLERLDTLAKDIAFSKEMLGEFALFKGIIAYFSAQEEESKEYLEEACENLKDDIGVILGEAELFYAVVLQMCGETEKGIQFLNQCLLKAKPSDIMYLSRITSGYVYMYMLEGDYTKAEVAGIRFDKIAEKCQSQFVLAWSKLLLGAIYFNKFDLEKAVSYFKSGLKNRYISDMSISVNAYIGLTFSFQLLQRKDEANNALEKLLEFVEEMNNNVFMPAVLSCQAWMDLQNGKLSSAISWAHSTEPPLDPLSLFVWLDRPLITKARILIEENTKKSLTVAVDLLLQTLQLVQSVNYTCHFIDLYILLSIAYQKQGDKDNSIAMFTKAVLLGESQRIIRPFMETKELITDQFMIMKEKNIARAFIEELSSILENTNYHGEEVAKKATKEKLKDTFKGFKIQKLTSREKEIIELVAKGYRNKEIADKLFISLDGVKKHIYRTYQKLHVKNRVELINLTKEQGLISE